MLRGIGNRQPCPLRKLAEKVPQVRTYKFFITENQIVVVSRLREKLAIDDDRWGRMCAEHALPLSWESMEYEDFLRERRRRMADIIRVAFRQLGGIASSFPSRTSFARKSSSRVL
jgi:hypothetical protein